MAETVGSLCGEMAKANLCVDKSNIVIGSRKSLQMGFDKIKSLPQRKVVISDKGRIRGVISSVKKEG